MNFDKFQRWINDYFIPTWKASFPRKKCVLVLDHCPYHLGGMTNPLSMSKTECTAALHKLLGRKKTFSVNRNGKLIQYKLPTVSESFAKAPRGPFTDELRVATYQALNEKAPNVA